MSTKESNVVMELEQQTVSEASQTPVAEGKRKVEALKREPKVDVVAEQPAQVTVLTDIEAEFGDFQLIDSSSTTGRIFASITDITLENEGKDVWIRARVQTVRGKGKNCFLILRDRFDTCQACVFANADGPSVEMVKYTSKIPFESWVDVFGTVTKAEVKSCTQKETEISMKKIFVVSAASTQPPFQLADAMRCQLTHTCLREKDELEAGHHHRVISQTSRLDNRTLDLRTPTNQAIFTIQSRIGQFFYEFMYKHNFIEIHTPKIVPGISEIGSQVFSLDYFGNKCHLAQSPQLYKQMVTVSDFGRVFEVGSVFHADHGTTLRHLCEFTRLDFEMTLKEHYCEVLDLVSELLAYILDRLNETSKKEILTINPQYRSEPIPFPQKALRITFNEAHEMLVAAGERQGSFDDISFVEQLKLGQLMKESKNCELYIIDKYPMVICPFYTMPDPVDPRYSNSFKVFLHGEEISSGSQRVHNPTLLQKQALEKGVPLDAFKTYFETFDHGALPHAGCGIGLERMTFAFLSLKNIRLATLFPRDSHRSTP